MKRLISLLVLPTVALAVFSQSVTLEQCREMALNNNKNIRIAEENIKKAEYQKKEAFAAYLPAIDFAGGYTYNSKNISIFSSDQYLPTKSFNMATQQYEFNLVKDPSTGAPIKGPDGQYIPSTVAMIPKEAMEFDMHNVFAGTVTLTQPIYVGGKIRAMNQITKYAEELAKSMHNTALQDVVYAVDEAYWMVVSLKSKEKLAQSYLTLLDTLSYNVNAMVEEGVATESDRLSVAVKQNEAQVTLTKVQNGLSLARMSLAQICGQPVNDKMVLADENLEGTMPKASPSSYDMNEVYSRRDDIHSLELATKIFEKKQNVALASMLPNIALIGSYTFSNPNIFNGFEKRFDGMFSVGAMLTIPIWHWGGNLNKYKAAKSETVITKLKLEDAKEKVELQVNMAMFKSQEATKTYETTKKNLANADANLANANDGFKEGVITADNVMAAQTAWLKAYSEKVDAEISVHLCDVYLSKVLGTMTINK